MKQANRKSPRPLNAPAPEFSPAAFSPLLALALALGITFTQVACAEDNDTAATAANAENAATETADASAEKSAPKFSAGMQIPVDGSSLEAFDASLAEIKSKATAQEYESLENAIQYLLVYDLSAKRDKAKLAANLNGQTGEEIVGRVKW